MRKWSHAPSWLLTLRDPKSSAGCLMVFDGFWTKPCPKKVGQSTESLRFYRGLLVSPNPRSYPPAAGIWKGLGRDLQQMFGLKESLIRNLRAGWVVHVDLYSRYRSTYFKMNSLQYPLLMAFPPSVCRNTGQLKISTNPSSQTSNIWAYSRPTKGIEKNMEIFS